MEESDAIQWKWVFASIFIFLIAQVAVSIALFVVGVLTLGVGFILFLFLKPIAYFATGVITGYLSPGVTIKEPAIGAIVISGVGLIFDIMRRSDASIMGTVIVGAIAYFLALAGAKVGERMQGNTA